MKAIRVHQFGGPEVLKLEDVPKPEIGSGTVLVKVHAAGINPVDTYVRSGAYAAKPNLPYTPGKDAAGVVEGVGAGVGNVKIGDRVYVGDSITGTYAEYVLCEPTQVHRLPEKVTYSQGAAVNVPYATAYRALFQKAQGVAGETVLVHGATGGVGIAAVQLAKAAGFIIIGTGGTEEGRKLVKEQGAHHVLDHRAPEYLKQILDLTGGRGVDLILEMAAHANLGKDLTLLAKGGRVAVIGSRGPVEVNPRDMMSRDAAIIGVFLNSVSPKDLAGIHLALEAGLENGALRPVVRKELPLAEAALGHKLVMEPGSFGKIVLIP
ncbi:NADPH:quinone reductase [Pedosphaera parvula]|uniref:Alcohol dehydrogenase zinc-binding domain protein n=1 Tax=Pedosphaera parvula (strain Ellin514) TaxID=320771 RepID=B9XJZ3_PEDPL|nr:NADPH:quinone reductase [Pedosphaera parvula]EEF59816.1 Alcohol dehydrogenase zinc-binding domain protein [Pedosphaera parvula Ellin514]